MKGFIKVSTLSPEVQALGEYLKKSRDDLMTRILAMDLNDTKAARLELAAYAGTLAFFMGSAISRASGGHNIEGCLAGYLQIIANHAIDEYTGIKATMPTETPGTETKQ